MITAFCLTSQNRFGRMSKTSFYITPSMYVHMSAKYYSANNIPGAKKGLAEAFPLSLDLLSTEPFFG